VVEGNDDSNVCYHLLKHYQLEKSIEIVDKKGIGNILSTLKVGIKGSGPQRLGNSFTPGLPGKKNQVNHSVRLLLPPISMPMLHMLKS